MSIRPKVLYFANRSPGLDPHSFRARWLQHGNLAMSLPIWENMWKYAQCDPIPLGTIAPRYDAIGLVWYKGLAAMANISAHPELRQPLLDDEMKTFATLIRDVAILTEEIIEIAGPETTEKVFILDRTAGGRLDVPLIDGTVRRVRSQAMDNDYTKTSKLGCQAVCEMSFANAVDFRAGVARLAEKLSAEECEIVPAMQRRMFGPFDG